jgi:hypothetical protein
VSNSEKPGEITIQKIHKKISFGNGENSINIEKT